MTPLRPPARPLPAPSDEHLWTWRPDDYLFRVFHEHPDRPPLRARTFGPLNRFDPHVRDRKQRPREQADGRGVNYLSVTLACALAEAFPDEWPAVAICPSARVVLAAPAVEVTLLDLTGDGALSIGAVGTLGSGNEPRRLTQRWARAIYEDYPSLAGIRYRAAHQGGVALAVWDRGGVLHVPPGTGRPAAGPAGRGHSGPRPRGPRIAGPVSGRRRRQQLPAVSRSERSSAIAIAAPRAALRPGSESGDHEPGKEVS